VGTDLPDSVRDMLPLGVGVELPVVGPSDATGVTLSAERDEDCRGSS
jgi:hypothetical protein